MRKLICNIFVLAAVFAATPALALDLNSFRAEHRLPPLSASIALAGEAYADAYDLANRNRLDHDAFRARARTLSSTAAQNVLVVNCARPDAKPVPTFAGRACGGCETADCAFRIWAKSPGHQRNMLMKGVSSYGLASATAANGRKYWVLDLGN